ncbi:MAG TPA: ABC transporter permease [Gemmatimonadaceae bacterium]
MKLATLLRIEWIKTTRRRAFWVAVGFLAILCMLVLGGEFLQGRQGEGAPLVAPFVWATAAAELDAMPAFFLALVVVMLVTSEFSWRTARQNVIDGLSREQFFAAKSLMVLMVGAAFIAVPFVIANGVAVYGLFAGATPATSGAMTPDTVANAPLLDLQQPDRGTERVGIDTGTVTGGLAPRGLQVDSGPAAAARRADSAQAALRQAMQDLRRQRPRPVIPAPDPDASFITLADMRVLGGFALGSVGFASMAFMLAVMLRSTGGAIGVFFLYFAFLEQVIVMLLRRFGSVELARDVGPYLPTGALRAPMDPLTWHPAMLERLNAMAASIGQPPQTVEGDPLRMIAVALAWILVFTGAAFLAFRRRDL